MKKENEIENMNKCVFLLQEENGFSIYELEIQCKEEIIMAF